MKYWDCVGTKGGLDSYGEEKTFSAQSGIPNPDRLVCSKLLYMLSSKIENAHWAEINDHNELRH